MTETEKKFYQELDTILDKIGINNEDKEIIFYFNPNGNQVGTSASVFVKINDTYLNADSKIPDTVWFEFLGEVSRKLMNLYNNQQKFDYLTVSIHGKHAEISYECDTKILMSERIILWKYDKFGIVNRTSKSQKRVLDKYRPLA